MFWVLAWLLLIVIAMLSALSTIVFFGAWTDTPSAGYKFLFISLASLFICVISSWGVWAVYISGAGVFLT